jgi:hypothetical protein
MRRRICLAVLMTAFVALAYLRSYEVAPTQANWSGWTNVHEPNNWVGNTFIANFDSICRCDVFIGQVGDTSHHYRVDVYDVENPTVPVAWRYDVAAPIQGHIWVKFELQTASGQKFTRGKEYLVKVTRPGDSVNYYYGQAANGGPYKYGQMIVGGQGIAA